MAAVAVAEEVCLPDVEVAEKGDRVLRRLLEGKGTIAIGSAPVSLLLEGDDPPVLCKSRQNLTERSFDR
jgi:hypothetical protein